MQITPTPLKGLLQIEPDVFGDARGKFVEIFHESRYDAAGVDKTRLFKTTFHGPSGGHCAGSTISWRDPKGNWSRSSKGAVYDVAVDIRQGSSNLRAMVRSRAVRYEHAAIVYSSWVCPWVLRAQRRGGISL